MRIAPSFHLADAERTQLQQWARGRRTPARLILRAKIVLLAADRQDNRHMPPSWAPVARRWVCGGSASRPAD